MFSNRAYGAKLAGALLVIALLGVLAAQGGLRRNPALWRCVAEPQRWDGTPLWMSGARIISTREADYEIEVHGVRIRVMGPPPATASEWIGLRGIFRAEGPSLAPLRARRVPPHARYRWLVEAVSVAVLLLVLANFSRHFLFRPRNLQAEGVD